MRRSCNILCGTAALVAALALPGIARADESTDGWTWTDGPAATADGASLEQTETFRYTRIALNQPIEPSLFTFVPPAGANQVQQFDMPSGWQYIFAN